jgi:transposase InsO family protein
MPFGRCAGYPTFRRVVTLHGHSISYSLSNRMTKRMSGKGNGYGNAVTETVFKTLKMKWFYGICYADEQELRRGVFEYIELFYNRKHMHSALSYLAPAEFMRV